MPKQKAVSRSEFIRRHINLSVADIISAGNKQGLKIKPGLISNVRHALKKQKAEKKQQKRGLATRRRKVVPTSGLEVHVREHQRALERVGVTPEMEALQSAIGEFLLTVVATTRELVRVEMRGYFKTLGG